MAETSARALLTPNIGGPSQDVIEKERLRSYPVNPVDQPLPSFLPLGSTLTWDYIPARDGLSLLTGGPTRAGYASNYLANPNRKWMPRFPNGDVPTDVAKGRLTDTDSFEADPEYAWSNGFNPFFIDSGGNLVIRARKVSEVSPAFGGGEVPTNTAISAPYVWVTGQLCSEVSFSQYGGYFEVECKVDTSKAVWPAFWTLTAYDFNKRAEIDIMERVGDTLGANTYHTNNIQSNSPTTDEGDVNTGSDMSTGFHKYGALVTDKQVFYYYDRKLVRTTDISTKPKFNDKHFLMLTNPVGTNLANWVGHPDGTTHSPADFVIKSVKAWQRPGPVSLNLSALTYLDDLTVGGTVATISSDYFGTDSEITFAEMSDPDSMFTIDSAARTIAAGKVSVPLKLSQVVPATTDDTHPLRLRAVDGAGRTFERDFVVKSVTALPIQANYVTNQDLTNAYWGKGGVTTIDANTIQETATTEDHVVFPGASGLLTRTAGVKTMRVWDDVELVAGGPTLVFIQAFDSSYAHAFQANFDLATQTIGFVGATGSWSAASGFLTQLPSGKIRVGVDWTTDGASTGIRLFLRGPQVAGGNSWAGLTSRRIKHSNVWVYNRAAGAGGS